MIGGEQNGTGVLVKAKESMRCSRPGSGRYRDSHRALEGIMSDGGTDRGGLILAYRGRSQAIWGSVRATSGALPWLGDVWKATEYRISTGSAKALVMVSSRSDRSEREPEEQERAGTKREGQAKLRLSLQTSISMPSPTRRRSLTVARSLEEFPRGPITR